MKLSAHAAVHSICVPSHQLSSVIVKHRVFVPYRLATSTGRSPSSARRAVPLWESVIRWWEQCKPVRQVV
jgi:hypothetical protein